jgi:hypothetical protein
MSEADWIGIILAVAFVGSSSSLLFLPKKGPQYAFRNFYRKVAFFLTLIAVAIVVGGILALAYLLPDDFPENGVKAILAGALLFLVIGAYALGQWLGPPAGRDRWLRKHYPHVAAAIQRYKQEGEVREDYAPVLIIEGKRYFLISFHNRKQVENPSGLLLLDEAGCPISDRDLFTKAAECKGLALDTIHYPFHQKRIAEIESFRRAIKTFDRVFAELNHKRDRFAEHGSRTLADLEKVLMAREPAQMVLETAINLKLLDAEYAASNGLGRLTEVSHNDVVELTQAIEKARSSADKGYEKLGAAAQPARRLAEFVERSRGIKKRKLLVEGLLALWDLGHGIEQETGKYEFAPISLHHWQAWRERTAWALQQQAASQEVPA